MEHAEALEQIEIAAVEPEGLDRLMAGDTPDVGGRRRSPGRLPDVRRGARAHPANRRRSSRDVIRSEPDPALRDRTLAFVRAVGRDRSDAGAVCAATSSRHRSPSCRRRPAAPVAPVRAARPGVVAPRPAGTSRARPPRGRRRGRDRRRRRVRRRQCARSAGRSRAGSRRSRSSSDATTTALRIQAQPDAQIVALSPTVAGGDASGSLAFSTSTGELVAVATNLEPEGAHEEYACWVEVGGQRQRLGRMYWAGELWAWAGPVDGLDAPPPGRRVRGVARARPTAAPASRPDREPLGRRASPLPPAWRRMRSRLRVTARGRGRCWSATSSSGVDEHVGRREAQVAAVGPQDLLGGPGSTAGSPSDRAIQAASAGISRSVTSRSRRFESARTSQVRAPPATTPTIRSHQLNSALIGCRGRSRNGGASRPRIADDDAYPRPGCTLRAMPILTALAALAPILALIAITPGPDRVPPGPDPGLLVRHLLRRRPGRLPTS